MRETWEVGVGGRENFARIIVIITLAWLPNKRERKKERVREKVKWERQRDGPGEGAERAR